MSAESIQPHTVVGKTHNSTDACLSLNNLPMSSENCTEQKTTEDREHWKHSEHTLGVRDRHLGIRELNSNCNPTRSNSKDGEGRREEGDKEGRREEGRGGREEGGGKRREEKGAGRRKEGVEGREEGGKREDNWFVFHVIICVYEGKTKDLIGHSHINIYANSGNTHERKNKHTHQATKHHRWSKQNKEPRIHGSRLECKTHKPNNRSRQWNNWKRTVHRNGDPILNFSEEMTKTEISHKNCAQLMNITNTTIRKGQDN